MAFSIGAPVRLVVRAATHVNPKATKHHTKSRPKMATGFRDSENGCRTQFIGKLRQISFGKPPNIINLFYVIKQRCAH